MIVADVGRPQPVRSKRLLQRGVVCNDRFGTVLGRFLRHVIAAQKVHDVREYRRSDVVQKPRDRLLFFVREVPDDQRDAEAVIEPRIRT